VTIPDNRVITVPVLREVLGLPAERPDGIRDLLAVARPLSTPIPADSIWLLALDGWPETWRAEPETGPRFLVMLRGAASPYFIATVEDINPAWWGLGEDSQPGSRSVPVTGTASATSLLAGCELLTDLSFGWQLPEEQYAFL
jgi:hypothetical protein